MTRKITPEEKKLWKLAVHDAKRHELGDFIDRSPAVTNNKLLAPAMEQPRMRGADGSLSTKLVKELIPNLRNAMDAGSFGKLRRGKIRPEARVDLHGLWVADAHVRVREFLQMSQAAGMRCVLVITGKGGIRGDGKIRSEFPRWLNDIELRSIVLSFTQASPEDGGAGAFYVYLRKSSI